MESQQLRWLTRFTRPHVYTQAKRWVGPGMCACGRLREDGGGMHVRLELNHAEAGVGERVWRTADTGREY